MISELCIQQIVKIKDIFYIQLLIKILIEIEKWAVVEQSSSGVSTFIHSTTAYLTLNSIVLHLLSQFRSRSPGALVPFNLDLNWLHLGQK
jgi:hypothetical protein